MEDLKSLHNLSVHSLHCQFALSGMGLAHLLVSGIGMPNVADSVFRAELEK